MVLMIIFRLICVLLANSCLCHYSQNVVANGQPRAHNNDDEYAFSKLIDDKIGMLENNLQ
jgi:hypothetical protein